jgi:Threonine aldolase
MKNFASDNNSGVHPALMEAIMTANHEHAVAYGDDEWTEKAIACVKAIFGYVIEPCFVLNGTGANMVALQACTRSFNSIICAATAHINVDECGAPAKFTSCMVKEIQTPDGKLTPELILPHLHGFGDQHHSQPKVVYISQSTEMGTVYTRDEMKTICDFAHSHDMYVHVDGSRLANACASLYMGMREITRDCGVDILSLGGTKNGMMMGEMVIAFRKELCSYLQYYRKQSAQLYSKMRYVSAQYIAYFQDKLWLENARTANNMAQRLYEELKDLSGIAITQKVEANALFLIMPKEVIEKIRQHHFFYTWDEKRNEIRLVCSWDTNEEDIEGFVRKLKTFL